MQRRENENTSLNEEERVKRKEFCVCLLCDGRGLFVFLCFKACRQTERTGDARRKEGRLWGEEGVSGVY